MMYAVLNSQYAYLGVTNFVFSLEFGGFLPLLKTQYFNCILLMTLCTLLKNIQ